MPRTKDTKKLMLVNKALPYLYVAIPDVKKSEKLPNMSNFVSLKQPGSKPPASSASKPKTISVGHDPKPQASMSGLTSRGRAALDAVPLKSITSKYDDDEGDE